MEAVPLSAITPVQASGYELEELDDELVLFDSATDTVVTINQTGALVWSLCDGQRTVADIIQLLADAYSENAVAIRQDVPRILHDYMQLKLVTVTIDQ